MKERKKMAASLFISYSMFFKNIFIFSGVFHLFSFLFFLFFTNFSSFSFLFFPFLYRLFFFFFFSLLFFTDFSSFSFLFFLFFVFFSLLSFSLPIFLFFFLFFVFLSPFCLLYCTASKLFKYIFASFHHRFGSPLVSPSSALPHPSPLFFIYLLFSFQFF